MSDDDEVGYGKPPKHSQFKKGQSGNPKGRPKGTKNLKTDLEEVLQKKVVIVEGGRRKVVRISQALFMVAANKGVTGDTKPAFQLLEMGLRILDQGEAGSEEEALTADDLALIEAHTQEVKRVRVQTSQSSGNDGGRGRRQGRQQR